MNWRDGLGCRSAQMTEEPGRSEAASAPIECDLLLPRLVMQLDDVSQNMRGVIHQADVSADRDIAMIRGRLRQLAREIAWDCVSALLEIRIERSARLEPRFLVRREPILRSEAHRRAVLMLAIPIVCRLTRMVVELRGPLAILIRLTIGWSSVLGVD